jgi:hypothetical protein
MADNGVIKMRDFTGWEWITDEDVLRKFHYFFCEIERVKLDRSVLFEKYNKKYEEIDKYTKDAIKYYAKSFGKNYLGTNAHVSLDYSTFKYHQKYLDEDLVARNFVMIEKTGIGATYPNISINKRRTDDLYDNFENDDQLGGDVGLFCTKSQLRRQHNVINFPVIDENYIPETEIDEAIKYYLNLPNVELG